jgi:arginine decarboxylase
VSKLWGAFDKAIQSEEYQGKFRGVYPIKVNQQRHIIEELIRHGDEFGLGLEAGSKPELLIALAYMENPESLLICNGYKDSAYIETVLLARKLGRQSIIVIDRYEEIDLIIQKSKELNVRPVIGIRTKLSSRGSGKWFESGGECSKFGLSITEILDVVKLLKKEKMLDCLQLLHFHIGSQITNIRSIKNALREASRIFVELHKLAVPLKFLDAGGGLGVDYDGSQSNFHSSVNYSLEEYAADIVAAIGEACNQAKVPHPDIITESGRALVAHHAVLIVETLGVSPRIHPEDKKLLMAAKDGKDKEENKSIVNLRDIYHSITKKNFLESYHDTVQIKEEVLSSFTLGYLDLQTRSTVERLFWLICEKIMKIVNKIENIPDDLETLVKSYSDLYYCNFSIFQSTPDYWAVKQLFPIMPLQQLDKEPTRKAIIADLTCDSDGKIDQFIDIHDINYSLPLHEPNGEPYYIGIFLIGAYQECLGDLHNLFGDTFAVNVAVDEDDYRILDVTDGDTVRDVLEYVQYSKKNLVARFRSTVETGLQKKNITMEESGLLLSIYEQALSDYTYLTRDHQLFASAVQKFQQTA